jgi:hypothetical protein
VKGSGSAQPYRHPQEDAWLLLSIHDAFVAPEHPAGADRVTLTEVIAVGDALNHAIFTYDELSYGLARLIERGMIIHDAGGFAIHPEFQQPMRKAARSYRTAMARVEALIGAAPWGTPGITVDLGGERYDGVTDEELDRAYRAYSAEMDPVVDDILATFEGAATPEEMMDRLLKKYASDDR